MGSLARQVKRNQQKIAYRAFSRVFMGERYYQEHVLREALDKKVDATLEQLDGKTKVETPLHIFLTEEETKVALGGQPRLGKKPNFYVWKRSIEIAKAKQEAEAKDRAKKQLAEDKKDLEWKDG